ncbi:MAG: lipocalin-like domain-containing protein [Terriglobia bacterium]
MSWCLFALLLVAPAAAPYRVAVPGYHFEFPRDNFNHPHYQTEWWYYTGNLAAQDGRQFGFELTFFRIGVSPRKPEGQVWDVRNIYLAHMAVSDLSGHRFYYRERFNRAGPGLAGTDATRAIVWNGNWSAQWSGKQQRLRAITADYAFELALTPLKPPVINGRDGISQKGPARGEASHYISLTRLKTAGTLTVRGKTYQVTGVSWMDHEFFTERRDPSLIGWDWFSVQLNNDTELMLYRLRLTGSRPSPYSSGTYVDAQGRSHFLSANDFTVWPGATWSSPSTRARYPIEWRISVPSLHLDLRLATPLRDQELARRSPASPAYWEGAVRLSGTEAGKKISGAGYLEMTGYAAPLNLNVSTRPSLQRKDLPAKNAVRCVRPALQRHPPPSRFCRSHSD